VTQPFTYQGYLRQGGAPLNNPSQAMRFRIFDALTGGTMLWDSGALTVNVANGLFTVQLNPPASIWTGADRFLEIQVGTTTLTPRVRIGSTPYANTATLLNMFQSGTMNPDRMVITHSPAFTNWGLMYRDTDDSFHFLAGGTTVLRVGLGGPTALQIPAGAAAGRVLTSDASGNASWQALPPSASAWAVSGTNIYNTNTGNVGIGTTTPTAKLDVRGGMLVDSSSGSLRIGYPSSANQWHFNTMNGGADLQLWENAVNTVRMYFKAGGNIGIGTTAPAARLDILGGNWDTASTEGDLRIGNATYRLKIGVATGGGGAGHATIAAQGGVNALSLGAGTTLDTQRTLTILGTGNVGIGTASPAATLDVNGNTILRGNISFDDDIRSIIFPPTTAPNEPMIYMFSSGTSNSDRMVIAHSPSYSNWGIQYRDSDDSIHFQGAGFTHVRIGLGDGNVGINTTAPSGRLHIVHNSTLASPTLRLHETEADSARLEFTNTNTARKWLIAGLIGASAAADRLNFWNSAAGDILSIRGDGTVVATNPSTAANAFALHGILSSTSPGPWCAAVRGQNNGTGVHGIGVWGSQEGSGYGVYGTSVSGIGVRGYASATGGITYGVVGLSDSTGGRGVSGYASAPSGFTYGVFGESASQNGSGVFGQATATSGAAWGVVGVIYSTASSAYGVYGSEPSGGAGHAVYASGTLAATGTKSFQIDHPLSPETHYLNHFCAEGPEPMNAYSGVVTLDARGEAWVQLPDYFEAINRDPRYTLTPIGAAMPNLHVAVKIQNNRFKIAGGAPGKEVSWRIEAVRNDLWVQRYGYQTEQEKEDAIKGKYLSPELYGQPKERGIHYRPEPEPVPSENGEAVRGTRTGRAP
jgi:hypothetical protein